VVRRCDVLTPEQPGARTWRCGLVGPGSRPCLTASCARGAGWERSKPDRDSGRFHRLVHDRQQLGGEGIEVELATLAWIDWFNHRRLHGQIGNLPPAELEATYYRQLGQAAVA
jgi:hypothetical protein